MLDRAHFGPTVPVHTYRAGGASEQSQNAYWDDRTAYITPLEGCVLEPIFAGAGQLVKHSACKDWEHGWKQGAPLSKTSWTLPTHPHDALNKNVRQWLT